MTLSFALPFPLPGDEDLIADILRQSGGLGAVTESDQPQLHRAVIGLDLMQIVHLAEQATADSAGLYQLWLLAHGVETPACGAWFNLGVARMRAGDAAAAAEAYRTALRLRPDLAEAAINLGNALEQLGQTDAALAAWRAALPTAALRQVLHNQLGRLYETEGRLGAAAEELRASLLISPDQPDVQQHLCICASA